MLCRMARLLPQAPLSPSLVRMKGKCLCKVLSTPPAFLCVRLEPYTDSCPTRL